MKFKSKIYLDYDDILSMCHNLEHDVSKFKPDLIVGITRGGLLPALHLSHALKVPMMTVMWQSRDTEQREYNEKLQQAIYTKRVVFVDDINDTGHTFSSIYKEYKCDRPTVSFAALVEKTDSCFRKGKTRSLVNASLTLEDQRWIVFPWEHGT